MNNLKFKDCVVCNCISYTVLTIILSLLAFNPDLMEKMTHIYTLKLFLCTTLISIFVYLTSRLPIESQPLYMLLQLLSVATVVLGIGGGLLHIFPWERNIVLEVIAVLIAVYFITYGIMVWHSNVIANKINKKLQERENESHDKG